MYCKSIIGAPTYKTCHYWLFDTAHSAEVKKTDKSCIAQNAYSNWKAGTTDTFRILTIKYKQQLEGGSIGKLSW